ncbi:hypothetical protein M501DRAFT_1004913 [Patellaria atrata CBS 101060]|uniref:magnesium chelatase n=1 Tax=Patellaria atrata CBS 101060 TaxID=1346257 RepID=A0A9P4S8Z1_9PEZI|nr:hypothetical protein M501DRAFT_1004913 [Patellaria atrata CBS 101060]
MDHVTTKIQNLSDLELAFLLCLVSDQHCIISAESLNIDALELELRLVAADVFGLSCTVLDCSETTSLDEFGNGVLVDFEAEDGGSMWKADDYERSQSYSGSQFASPRKRISSPGFNSFDSRQIADIVIAKNLNLAQHAVQIQALELIRGKRVFTRTAVHAAPKKFVFVALLSSEITVSLTSHLNDQFAISHFHATQDGLPNLEERASTTDDGGSISSVIRPTSSLTLTLENLKPRKPLLPKENIDEIVELTSKVKVSPEVRAYLHNITVFLRMHRAVAGGISATATRHFNILVKALASLHSLSYVPPSLVALAARKVYPHRIVLTEPKDERSMQWGSSLEAVERLLDGTTAADVIEEVLTAVEMPL